MCDTNDDQIVISGISGRYPDSDNIYEFWEGIVNGVELNSSDGRRWPVDYVGLPPRSGKIKNIEKVDANFFKLTDQDADYMDPQIRLLFEVAYEAIMDAGVISEDLRGSKTAFAIGLCYDDTNKTLTNDITQKEKNRVVIKQGPAAVSRAFGLIGAAFEVDTACASSFSAFYEGMTLMKAGHCEQLLVGGVACHLTPSIAYGFMQMQMIAPDGRSKCLDASVNGYCRSEAVVALFIQKRKHAKRIYASVLACETNADGFKPEGITFPGYETQKELLNKTIIKSGIDKLSINYIEAHITGTAAGDPIESRAILDSYRGEDKKPIMFGCLKSNIGHTEGASTNCAITKVALIFQKHCIPPNLNYKTPNPNIDGLLNKRIVPVLEKTEFHDEIIPVNSFGFGGVNVHALLKANEKVVTQESYKIIEDIPRLVNISGRTEEGLEYAMKWIQNNRKDVTKDFLALLNDVSKTPLETGMYCRAFMILDEKSVLKRRVFRGEKRRPLWFVFSALGCQWKAMAKQLMTFDIFSTSLHKCAKVLKSVGVNLIDLLLSESADIDTDITSALVSIVSTQIALVDTMSAVGIEADGIVGHSIGEVVAGYADGCLTLEEAILTAYYIAKCSKEAQREKGAMAAIGLSWEEAVSRCPSGVYPACDNSVDGITVSGSQQNITDFINELKSENIFAKSVNSCEMAYHCPLVNASFEPIVNELEKVIKNPKVRSKRWISTSLTKNGEGMFCNAHYYANNVVSAVEFKEALKIVPEDACIVEVGPSAILLPIVKRCLSKCQSVALMKKDSEENILNILSAMGEMYCSGNNVQIENLYPKVEYPVPRETLSLSHLLKWDHSKSYFVAKFPEYFSLSRETMTKEINVMSKELKFIEGHCIDGRNLFPATGYLYYVWSQYAFILGVKNTFDIPVEFRDIKLNRATIVPKSGVTDLIITINEFTGLFSVSEGGSVCVTGIVRIPVDDCSHSIPTNQKENSDCLKLTTNDIYKELRVRGYDYGPSFQGLVEANADGSEGKVKWTGHWISFTDSMLHLSILGSPERVLRVPTSIEYMRCDPKQLFKAVESQKTLDVFFDKETNVGVSDGVTIKGLKGTTISRRTDNQTARLMYQTFTPYDSTIKTNETRVSHNEEYFKKCMNLLERLYSQQFTVSEDEEESHFNSDSNEEYAFYKKLIEALKEKQKFEEFCESIRDSEKSTVIFSSNFNEIIVTQFKQIIENIQQRVLNVLEYNATENKLKNALMDVMDPYLLKYDFHSLTTQGNGKGLPPSFSNLDLVVYKDVSTELITDNTSLKSNEELIALINSCYKALKVGGYLLFTFRDKMTALEKALLSRRNAPLFELNNEENIKNMALDANFKIIAKRSDDLGIVSFVFKKVEEPKETKIIKIETCADSYDWVERIKQEIKDETNEQRVWIVAKDSELNGVLGLTRCLKKEPGGHRIRCFVSDEKNIPANILEKDLVLNVLKQGSHGVYIQNDIHEEFKELNHVYLDIKTKGDLSSFRWYEASHKNWSQMSHNDRNGGNFVNIYYGALNFKDVMVASGRIPTNAYPNKWHVSGSLGMEYSGVDENGNRVMGISNVNTLATTLVTCNEDLSWSVPGSWTLEDAATVPVVYMTVFYALIMRAKLREREKILVHAGSGGVGQAAIAVCLSMGCEVFTSVGTEEKKQFLKELFPQLEDKHFVNSRDLTFEENILKETNGRGVDVILNSLAEEKLRASINCLADFGRFVEIGKYDIIQNNPFDSTQFTRNQTYHTVCLAHLLAGALKSKFDMDQLQQLNHLFDKALKRGEIKPLRRTVFKLTDAEKAFRFMASGKHIGKVLLQIRDEEQNEISPETVTVKSIAQTYCHPSKVYILVGGLGGIGLELAFWLTNRGAKKLVITSRTGIKDNFQRYIIKSIEERGVTVEVVVNDSSTCESTFKLVEDAMKMGPIGGVFNLAMVLNDALIENQTPETFRKVCAPKIDTTVFLDQITRNLCPKLDYFVCFSSAACGRGNGGQSNYGFANSFMESICQKRRRDNLHGVAIQWGPVGDVGFFMDNFKVNDVIIAGTVPQRIPSFMSTLDTLMNSNYDVCSSAVYVSSASSSSTHKGDLLKTICHVLGVSDPSTLENHTTLGDLGMDSLMAVEIKQGLERDYNTVMSTQEIRQLTIQQIRELSSKKVTKIISTSSTGETEYTSKFENPKELFKKLDNGNQGVPVFFVPPIEGDFNLMKPLVEHITRPVIGLNWTDDVDSLMSIEEVAAFYVKKLRETYSQPEYELVAYSFGSLIAFEMCVQLQEIDQRLVKKLFILDGDIDYLKKGTQELREKGNVANEKDAFQALLIGFMTLIYPFEIVEKLRKELIPLNTKDEQIKITVNFINYLGYEKCTEEFLKLAVQRQFDKLKRIHFYEPTKKFKGDVKLIVSTREESLDTVLNESKFRQIIDGTLEVKTMTGDHRTFLTINNAEIGDFLEKHLFYINS